MQHAVEQLDLTCAVRALRLDDSAVLPQYAKVEVLNVGENDEGGLAGCRREPGEKVTRFGSP